MNLLGVTLVTAALAAWGCSKGNSVADQDDGASQCVARSSGSACPAQRRGSQVGRSAVFCVVNLSNELGCMGVPYKLTIDGRTVFLCCEHCADAALKDPKATLATLDGLLQKNSARLQKTTK